MQTCQNLIFKFLSGLLIFFKIYSSLIPNPFSISSLITPKNSTHLHTYLSGTSYYFFLLFLKNSLYTRISQSFLYNVFSHILSAIFLSMSAFSIYQVIKNYPYIYFRSNFSVFLFHYVFHN